MKLNNWHVHFTRNPNLCSELLPLHFIDRTNEQKVGFDYCYAVYVFDKDRYGNPRSALNPLKNRTNPKNKPVP